MSYLSLFMRYNEFYKQSKLWYSIFIIIIIGMKKIHVLLCIQDINSGLV